jgi:hypothetical protein
MHKKESVMEQSSSTHYATAWSKIAEFVSTNQKERALGLYRLLSHSLKDKALMHQLEGDLYCAFQDDITAIPHYEQAALSYQQDNRLHQAALILDHLTTLQPMQKSYRTQSIALYKKLKLSAAVHKRLEALYLVLSSQGRWEEVYHILVSLEDEYVSLQVVLLTQAAHSHLSIEQEYSHRCISVCVNNLSNIPDIQQLHGWLGTLATKSTVLHDYATTLITKAENCSSEHAG